MTSPKVVQLLGDEGADLLRTTPCELKEPLGGPGVASLARPKCMCDLRAAAPSARAP